MFGLNFWYRFSGPKIGDYWRFVAPKSEQNPMLTSFWSKKEQCSGPKIVKKWRFSAPKIVKIWRFLPLKESNWFKIFFWSQKSSIFGAENRQIAPENLYGFFLVEVVFICWTRLSSFSGWGLFLVAEQLNRQSFLSACLSVLPKFPAFWLVEAVLSWLPTNLRRVSSSHFHSLPNWHERLMLT